MAEKGNVTFLRLKECAHGKICLPQAPTLSLVSVDL